MKFEIPTNLSLAGKLQQNVMASEFHVRAAMFAQHYFGSV
jgi:hypothetical protein